MTSPESSDKRIVYFVSDRSGVTAETLGNSLLTQFDGIEFQRATVPFVDTVDKAKHLQETISGLVGADGRRPMVFSTTVDPEIRSILQGANGLFIDLFGTFVGQIERELHHASAPAVGRAHGMQSGSGYDKRIEAMNFALAYDDGSRTRNFERAELILLGVSRSGKTPTCLFLAMQYGIFAANYPLIDDDLEAGILPRFLTPHRDRLYGLNIDVTRLQQIRSERRPDSRYCSAEQCRWELDEAQRIFRKERIPHIDTTHKSIEEIASTILNERGLKRSYY